MHHNQSFKKKRTNSINISRLNIDDDCPYDSSRSPSIKCQLSIANELYQRKNPDTPKPNNRFDANWNERNGLFPSEKSQLIEENDLTTEGFVTAEDDSPGEEKKPTAFSSNAGNRFLRHKFPAHKYKVGG